MKSIFLISALISSSAFAITEVPLLTKTYHSGYVAPGYRTSLNCEIYSNKIVLKQEAEFIGAEQTRQYVLSGDLKKVIYAASMGRIEESPAPVDAPVTIYKAYNVLTNASVELSSSVNYRGNKAVNQSQEARGLINLMDMLCK
ncbi:hypothetical protein [Fluviispira sanaruensis]|uniref:Uncharacterized protein n=1 Tax=Fluviispira sanaruensis TaxID=2493639 RepID=A0A4P2VH38_FLUSA|nr:hypothetical protein [Fluviispira sanaruensis]BBH52186.1 hypothetical protein JCM31447_06260 [Fluviispira sanaruensis]